MSESTAENLSGTSTAEIIPPTGDELRITEAGEVREFEDSVEEIIDR